MEKLAHEILSIIPRSVYADVRVVEQEAQEIATKDGVVEALQSSTSYGYGVRVLENGSWGFAASYDTSKKGIDRTVKAAREIAKSTSAYKNHDVTLSGQKPIKASYKNKIKNEEIKVKRIFKFCRYNR